MACPLVDQRGQTALFLATKNEDVDAVEALLAVEFWKGKVDNYLDLAAGDGCGASPLYVAISRGNADLVAFLLRHGASPAFLGQLRRERWPRTPLSRACRSGHVECVRSLLLSAPGARTLNLAAAHHRTPLMEAAWHLQAETVRLLLAQPDVDVLLANDKGCSALQEAVYWGKGRQGPGSDLERASLILELLLQHCAERCLSLDQADVDGCGALSYAAAAQGDQVGWVAKLLAARADPCGSPSRGSKAGGWDAVRTLPEISAQPWGGTPLEEAATRSNVGVVEALLASVASRVDLAEASARSHDCAKLAEELVAIAAGPGRQCAAGPFELCGNLPPQFSRGGPAARDAPLLARHLEAAAPAETAAEGAAETEVIAPPKLQLPDQSPYIRLFGGQSSYTTRASRSPSLGPAFSPLVFDPAAPAPDGGAQMPPLNLLGEPLAASSSPPSSRVGSCSPPPPADAATAACCGREFDEGLSASASVLLMVDRGGTRTAWR